MRPGLLPFATRKRLGKCTERLGRIGFRAGVAATAPIEEDAVDTLLARRERPDQRRRNLAIAVARVDAEPPHESFNQRLLEPLALAEAP